MRTIIVLLKRHGPSLGKSRGREYTMIYMKAVCITVV